MGSWFSLSMPCAQVDKATDWVSRKWSYIYNLRKNMESLEKNMGLLKAKRDDVQRRVDREEFTRQRQRLEQVKVWLTDFIEIEKKFNDLISTREPEFQRLCLCGFCSKNFKLSYSYGKRVFQMLKDVERLISQGDFPVVTDPIPIPKVEELPIQHTIVGQETELEKVWNHLMGDKVGIVGLHGMGGVGKTTLLKQINNKLSQKPGVFDIVIYVEVSKNAKVREIQEKIGRKLNLSGEEWDEKDDNERALDIHNILKRKKFVLLLDNVWEKVILNDVGVPFPSRENGCKVVFTTRFREVCMSMEVDDAIEVRCLDDDKARDLFKKKVGERALGSDPAIQELAEQVAKKCCGLPLALNVIGNAMACKSTVQEWYQAYDVLPSSASEKEILPILKYSYDSLSGEHVKSCFLYCSLIPEDHSIDKERLIEYWIGEGFIDEWEGREMAFKQGFEVIGTLVSAYLLQEEEDDDFEVKMHDVVREMALWIVSDLGNWIVKGGLGLREVPKVKDWKKVRRMSLMKNDIAMISESHECPELETLLLGENPDLVSISGEFFRSMRSLLVLDLSRNYSLSTLPEEISGLVALRYLDLSCTKIRRLPVGLQKLKRLIHLNLEETEELESLRGISKLTSLRTLKLQFSKVWLDMSIMKELQLLEHLEYLSITIPSSLIEKLSLYAPRVRRCIQNISIRERSEESVSIAIPSSLNEKLSLYAPRVGRYIQNISTRERSKELVRVINLAAMENIRAVFIQECKMEEIKIEKTTRFSYLVYVELEECDGLKDLTWLLSAPNLLHLGVKKSKTLEEIISEEKATSVLDKGTDLIPPFKNLEVLELFDLPELKSIYWNALPFQRLRELDLVNCPKLSKLPLDSKSVGKVEDLVIWYACYDPERAEDSMEYTSSEQEWLERLEWVDDATRQRFLPRLQCLVKVTTGNKENSESGSLSE